MNPIASDSLSAKQRECLRLVWDRLSSKEIALRLGISKNTVDGYIAEAVARLGARDRRDAARLCFETSPPDRIGGDLARVVAAPPIVASRLDGMSSRSREWQRWLPFRTGAHNELSVFARPLWIVGIAVITAFGFGAFASGVHFLSDLFR